MDATPEMWPNLMCNPSIASWPFWPKKTFSPEPIKLISINKIENFDAIVFYDRSKVEINSYDS